MSRPIDADKLWKEITRRMDCCDDILEIIEEQPTVEADPDWTPCNKALPTERGMYLVTMTEKAKAEDLGFDLDEIEVTKMRFDESGWRIPRHIPEWINNVITDEVFAWKPMPEPYQKEGEK